MSAVDLQGVASVVLAVGGAGAFLTYWKDRRKAKAEGTVAAATVEIQVEAKRLANLEQRFAFAQKAWDEERTSLTRRIKALEEELEEERQERAEEKTLHEEKVGLLEERLRGMQRELADLAEELAQLRTDGRRNGGP